MTNKQIAKVERKQQASSKSSFRSAESAIGFKEDYVSIAKKARLVPELLSHTDVLTLQRTVGNQRLQRVIQRGWFDGIGDAVSSAANKVGDLIDDFDTKSRKLSNQEIAEAREIFGDTIDYRQVVLERNSLYNAGSSRTVGNTIALTDNKFDGKNLKLNSDGQYTLIHELAHVWQYQNQGWEYAPAALWAQAKAKVKTGSRNAAYDWEILDKQSIPWEDWNPEAQAQAVEDYNYALRQAKSGRGTMSDYKILGKAWRYVEKMRYLPPGLGDFPVASGDQRNT